MAKYQDIYQELREQIAKEKYRPGEYLPSENELMELYGCSRDTIRKALSALAQNDLIYKEKGKGSRVLDPDIVTFPMSGITSFKELKEASPNDKIETDVIEVATGRNPWGQKKLNLSSDQDVTKVVRVRCYDGAKVILDKDYLNASIIPGITEEIAADSLYSYIEGTLGLNVGFARKEITVEPANKEEKELLDMKDFDLLVVVRSYTYLEDATLFQYTVSKHRPDKFKFLDFAKRSKL